MRRASAIAADLLGLPVGGFRLVQADTRSVARGHGHGGARSLHMGGEALVRAIDAVLARARGLAAQLLQCAEGELTFAEGRFGLAGDARTIGLIEVAARRGSRRQHRCEGTATSTWSPSPMLPGAGRDRPRDRGAAPDRYTAVDDYGGW